MLLWRQCRHIRVAHTLVRPIKNFPPRPSTPNAVVELLPHRTASAVYPAPCDHSKAKPVSSPRVHNDTSLGASALLAERGCECAVTYIINLLTRNHSWGKHHLIPGVRNARVTVNLVFIRRVKIVCLRWVGRDRRLPRLEPTTADYDRTFSIGPTMPDPIQPDATGHARTPSGHLDQVVSDRALSAWSRQERSWSRLVGIGGGAMQPWHARDSSPAVQLFDVQLCHRRRNRGGEGALAPSSLSREGKRKEVSAARPPHTHFWARTYLKIPPRSLFFHPHNSTVLTPNQSVRCFEKFIGVGTRGGGCGEPSSPVFLQWGGGLMLEVPSGQFFSVQRYNILHNPCISVYEQTLELSKCRKPCRSAAYFTHYTNLFGSLKSPGW